MRHQSYPRTFWAVVLFSLLLSSCTGMTFSPEAAAIQSARSSFLDRLMTYHVWQTQTIGGKTFVLLSSDLQVIGRSRACIYTYTLRKNESDTWTTAGGGGYCQDNLQDGSPLPPEEMVEVDSGSFGSTGPDDPGFCYAAGIIRNKLVKQVQVTWNEGQTQAVELVNDSFIAARIGDCSIKSVTGYDDQARSIYQVKGL